MTLNDPNAGSLARTPGATITLNGTPLTVWTEWEVINNPGHYVSDTFTVHIPLYGQTVGTFDLSWWLAQSQIEAVISASTSTAAGALESQQMIDGLVDTYDFDLGLGVLTFTGRDYTGVLIDTRVNQAGYYNQTSSQIATTVAGNHGLTPNVASTSTPIGTYYNDQNTRSFLPANATEWDLLTELANREGFMLDIVGKTLSFQPKQTTDTSNPYVINCTLPASGPPTASNFVSLKGTKSLTLARDLIVTIHSADPLTGKAISATVTATNAVHANRAGTKAAAQHYDINIAALTQAAAQTRAQTIAQELSQHEVVLNIDMPGDPLLGQLPPIQLTGTNTPLDQIYYLDHVTHRMAADEEGYTSKIRAKNTPTGTQYNAASDS